MKALVALLLLLLATSCTTQLGSANEDPWIPENAVLLMRDEFDDNTLNPDLWNTCHWWSTDGGCTIASNDELQWYLPDNVSIADGMLRLEARIEPATGTDGSSFDFTSGMVTTGPPATRTDAKFAFQYGGAEARIRVPAGAEFWPAFWLLPASTESRPEIDIMEMHGDEPRTNDMRFHSFDSAGERGTFGDSTTGPDFTAGWHNFGVIWSPDQITWTIDGEAKRTFRIDNDLDLQLPHEPLYLVLNLAIDSDATPPLAGPEAFPAVVEVDWVQVWQFPGTDGE